jgi:hypothetical protein
MTAEPFMRAGIKGRVGVRKLQSLQSNAALHIVDF